MTVELRPFQAELVDKLGRPKITARLIGDDCGLGKTYEGSAIDKALRAGTDTLHTNGRFRVTLIVCPRSVFEKWRDVLLEFMPHAKIMIINRKDRHPFVRAAVNGTHSHLICHYEALRLMPELKKVRFFHILLDETHRIKNRKTQQTRAVKQLKTTYKTSMSGTPADDKPEDVWSTLNFLYPGTFRGYWPFVNAVCQVTTETIGQSQKTFKKVDGMKKVLDRRGEPTEELDPVALKRFHAMIEPFYMRRLKEDVLDDLPEKYYSQLYVDLSPTQQKVYDQLVRDMLAWIGEHEDEPLSVPVVIAQLVRLQQCSLGHLEWYESRPGVEKIRITEPSSKLDELFHFIKDEGLCQRGRNGAINPIVQFSNSVSYTQLVTRRLTAEGLRVAEMTGATPDWKRDELQRDFQNGQYDIWAGTIKTGGESIDLFRASTVTFSDRAWNPSKNTQAEDRLHRMGQKNAVHVVDFMARDTVDLRVRATNIRKWSNLKAMFGDR